MAKKIGKSYRRGSKNHGQQTGLRDRASYIDTIVDSAQTGVAAKRGKRLPKKAE